MALVECVSDLICFRHFFDEWRQELRTETDSVSNDVLSAMSRECESDNADLSFETFAAQTMGHDIVRELEAFCRLVEKGMVCVWCVCVQCVSAHG